MLTITIDGREIDLNPLAPVLASTGIDQAVLDLFQADQTNTLLSDNEPSNPIWQDEPLRKKIIQSLAKSVPSKMSIAAFPTLPDQFAMILRSELTLANNRYPLKSIEKDNAEQLLQDLTRPIIYHLIERHYAGEPHAEPISSIITKAISQTITAGWQTTESNGWEIHMLDSQVGPVGYRFRNGDQTIYSDSPMTAEGAYFVELAQSLAQALCAIDLHK